MDLDLWIILFNFVSTHYYVLYIVGRWSHYVHIKELWKNFEATVKDFLEWLMAEGKSFSKDVTTLGGVKGVSDHMKTCEVTNTPTYIHTYIHTCTCRLCVIVVVDSL